MSAPHLRDSAGHDAQMPRGLQRAREQRTDIPAGFALRLTRLHSMRTRLTHMLPLRWFEAPDSAAELVDGRGYRFDHLTLPMVIKDMRFVSTDPAPGDHVPAFDLPAIDGGRVIPDVEEEDTARLGASVLLAERDRIGGDCTWTGCVPSKSLVRVAKRLTKFGALSALAARATRRHDDRHQVGHRPRRSRQV